MIIREDMLSQLHRAQTLSPSTSYKKKTKKDTFGEGKESAGAVPTFISTDRIKELDWNAEGNISFKEFLYAFEGWVGVDEE